MSIASDMKAVVAAMAETDRRHARRTGLHIDRQLQTLKEFEESETRDQLALPTAGTSKDFEELTVKQLDSLLRHYKIRNRSSKNRKRLKKADKIALAVEHGLPCFTYEFLLQQYLDA